MGIKNNVSFGFLRQTSPSKGQVKPCLDSHTLSGFSPMIVGVDRLDKDLTIGQMQGKYLISLLYANWDALFGQ